MDRRKTKNMLMRALGIVCVMAICLALFAGCNEGTSEAELKRLEEEFITLNGELGSLQNEYEEALEQNEAAKAEIEELNGKNAEAEKQIEELKKNNEDAKAEIDALKGENRDVKDELEALKSDNEETLKELAALKEQFEGLLDHVTPDPSDEIIRIYIDQGHNPTNYHNSGAVGNGLYEQDLTFTVGRLLAGFLLLDGRFEVCLSRPASNTVLGINNEGSLEARVVGAQEFEADYFISLHANSFSNENVKGCEIWVASAEVNDNSEESYKFGNTLLSSMAAATGSNNRGMKESSTLYVLKNATMPAVLIEMGFITNAEDAALMKDSPELFAQGIYNGILAYFELELQ